jgi:hypothetical protein
MLVERYKILERLKMIIQIATNNDGKTNAIKA